MVTEIAHCQVATPIGNIVKTTENAAHKENLSKIHKEFEIYEKLLSGPFFGSMLIVRLSGNAV